MKKYERNETTSLVRSQTLLYEKGPTALKDRELLEIAVASSDFDVAANIGKLIDEIGIKSITVDSLISINGMCETKAYMLIAMLEFWKRKNLYLCG